MLSVAGKALWKALDDPDNWTWGSDRIYDPFTITYKDKYTFWVANGGFFLEGYANNTIKFGLIERYILWHKIKKMEELKFAEFVLEVEEDKLNHEAR